MLTQKLQKEKREIENEHACVWGRERPPNPVAPLFMFFFLPLGLPYINWACQECCLFYLRSSLRSLDLLRHELPKYLIGKLKSCWEKRDFLFKFLCLLILKKKILFEQFFLKASFLIQV